MNICFVMNVGWNLFAHDRVDETFGGAEVDAFLIGSSLKTERDYSVSYIVYDYEQGPSVDINNFRIIASSKPPFKKNRILWFPFYIFKLWSALRKADADIYIKEGAQIEAGIIAFFCKVHGKKFVFRAASMIDCDGTYVKKNPMHGIFYSFGLSHANALITQTREQRHQLSRIMKKESVVIPNAYPIPTQLPSLTNKKTLLWVGRLIRLKQPDILLELARQLSSYTFVVIGNIEQAEEKFGLEIRDQLKIQPNITFYDYIPFNETQTYYNHAALLLNTSEYEGFPNSYNQAFIGATPVVSLQVDPDNILTEKRLGFCSKTIEQMKRDIATLLTDKNLYKSYSENTATYARSHMNMQHTKKQYLELFQKLA